MLRGNAKKYTERSNSDHSVSTQIYSPENKEYREKLSWDWLELAPAG